ncbi:Very-long-chain (3R)-3-hydroxyacyl-CoA dehydratase PASTICCINO 2 [Quaeritorhiza haematococci]|nr:Very-long-chain (3R)-3-hydroxyacyl-CoA dehydratase PASTICCINO 2 [Quaeritorhiza haematococci]
MSKKSASNQVPEGIVFPKDPKKPGDQFPRSSTYGNKNAFAAAIASVDQKAAEKLLKERQWRQKYTQYIVDQVKTAVKAPENAVAIARAGLDYCYKNFEFVRAGKAVSFAEAMESNKDNIFKAGVIKGSKSKPTNTLKVPYKGEQLEGERLIQQLQKWAEYGTIEPSTAEAISLVVKNQSKWLDLSDKTFVLLGAASAMGPYPLLMALGANVIAIDLNRPQIWRKLIDIAANSPGTLTFPLRADVDIKDTDKVCENAGCNLLTETPEIRNWLLSACEGKDCVVGSYAYLDGELHVRLSLAMDAIVRDLIQSKKVKGCAYLCTPTDVHVIPSEAQKAAKAHLNSFGFPVPLLFRPFLPANIIPPVAADNGKDTFTLVDGLANAQGPNYALAKRMQHWRAVVAREDLKAIVSTNIAPSTSTQSVVHNKSFALAYKGMPWFKPMEIFAPESSNAVMLALLIHDLNNPKSVSHPQTPLRNPMELFADTSFHGGIWRIPYKLDSIGYPSALLYVLTRPLAVILFTSAIALLAAVVLSQGKMIAA